MKQNQTNQEVISQAIELAAEMGPQQTDGKWLENLIEDTAEFIKDWDIAKCQPWANWEDRKRHFPESTEKDLGIDLVAVRRSDGEYIAIQSKSRQLDESNSGNSIGLDELNTFIGLSATDFWAERWVVTNGNCRLGDNLSQVSSMTDKPVKLVNIVNDLLQQQTSYTVEVCAHCEPHAEGEEIPKQTKTCMQSEAIDTSVRLIRKHAQSNSGGLPIGQARGKIILPCGTGKTRISLRIIEQLTPQGGLSVVLCPSIALVAQIRSEYLQNAEVEIRALAVCSDKTAGYDPQKEDSRNTAEDPTLDNSNVSASDVKGKVTTHPDEIAQWIRQGIGTNQVSIIFGTYQSGRAIANSLENCGESLDVLVADEAHRTAGLRRKRRTNSAKLTEEEQRIRDFTLCHDNNAFPATYRIYQTATPRIFDTSKVKTDKESAWIVRTMDDEKIFGVELYRKSYVEAVKNGWLSDYRIIALGTNDPTTYKAAYELATSTQSKGRRRLTSADYLRGLAFTLAMGGATQNQKKDDVHIQSCIAFMNTVDKSKNMAEDLQTDVVRNWLQNWMNENQSGKQALKFSLEHLDATSNVVARKNAIRRLGEAHPDKPYGIINVGIFGEGTDSPSLNAVAFLESRRSPVDVVQAVGRAMRTAPGKQFGYIICPILIPPNVVPEDWISSSAPEEGWQELGQILRALRAHDSRIEDELTELMQLYLPASPEEIHTIIAIAEHEKKRIKYRLHVGAPGDSQIAVERVLMGQSTVDEEFFPISKVNSLPKPSGVQSVFLEPTLVIAGKSNEDKSIEVRRDSVARDKPLSDGMPGKLDMDKTKKKARDMINKGTGTRLPTGEKREKRKRRTHQEIVEGSAQQMLRMTRLDEFGNSIRMNLLSKSGLIHNRIVRDLNILEDSIKEAALHLRGDELAPTLNRHFGLTNLKSAAQKRQADGVTIASLLMMNAAMLHQRIAHGHWLSGVSDLSSIKNDVNVVTRVRREWERIMRHDFRPVLEPAVGIIETVEDTGKLAGMERALRHIASEAERIAETYADMGADHAGPLFNRVMGNQASDGAFFTRPNAASIAARLTLDAYGNVDWTDSNVWRNCKIVDLACGSGTLLAAILTEMKHRAREKNVDESEIANLQKIAVEESIKGLDINPVSLQLAASQLTAGNQNIRYRSMGLHLMPYGPSKDNSNLVSAGTLELLGQKAIVPRVGEVNLSDEQIESQQIWEVNRDAELEEAVDAVNHAQIVIMNPPFTNRARMGEKFPKGVQKQLRSRADAMESVLVNNDPHMEKFVDKNSIRPLFVALADRCLDKFNGILTMVIPTTALSAPSGLHERVLLAQRYHIHSIVTCHLPGQINMSQNTNINESIVIAKKTAHYNSAPTRIVNLDRFPIDENDVADLHNCILHCGVGAIANGWGEISEWPAERINVGDWSAAVWRSSKLAKAAAKFANDENMKTIAESGYSPAATGQMLRGSYQNSKAGTPGSFPILKSKGAKGQLFIESRPDEFWMHKPKTKQEDNEYISGLNKSTPANYKILQKAGHLLVTAGQDNSTARLTATASDEKYVGNGWIPVGGLTADEAKSLAVFINSTIGRLQLMRYPGKKLAFPTYSTTEVGNLRIPDIKDDHIRRLLLNCWEQTKALKVPQFRDGESEVRQLWDEAVAVTLNLDSQELAKLRTQLNDEPHVRGRGYNQFIDDSE